jgi:hypothetical protein
MTVVSLFWTWALIVAVCTAGCAVARLVGERLDDAEAARSLQQWQLMCEALEVEDFADHTYHRSTASPG